MKSQIEKLDETFLQWIEATFPPILPGRDIQILFAPPRRAFAEYTSGRLVGHKKLEMPRITLSRQDYVFAPERQNYTTVRHCGHTSLAGTAINTSLYPIPIDIPYQLDFWTEYEPEAQALIATLFRGLYAGILGLYPTINVNWGTKFTPLLLEGTVTNNTDLEPGDNLRQVRYTAPFKAEYFVYSESFTEVPTVREIVLNARDYNTHVLWQKERVLPPIKIDEGDGLTVTFTYTLQKPTPVLKESGADGDTTSGWGTFTAATATFQTNGVEAGHYLRISTGNDSGLYTITAVPSETSLSLAPTVEWTDGGAGTLSYEVYDGIGVQTSTIVAFAVCGGVEIRGYDDGAGVISGTDVSGTITYATGAISLTFTTPPDADEGVFVEYQEETAIAVSE